MHGGARSAIFLAAECEVIPLPCSGSMGYKKGINPWGMAMSGIQRRFFYVILLAATMLAVMACSSSSSEKDNVFMRAEKGDAKAQFVLGLKYDTGKGVRQDYTEAEKWYRKAAEQGYGEAQFNLGTMYDEGRGVRQDYSEAAKWYRKAKDQGVASVQ